MLYEYINGKVSKMEGVCASFNPKHQYLGIYSVDESGDILRQCGFNPDLMAEQKSMSYENYEGFDFACLRIMNKKTIVASEKIDVFMNKNTLLFISRNSAVVEKILLTENAEGEEELKIGFDRVLCTFFERMTAGEPELLENIEQEIADLENALITSKKHNCVKEIISLRKRLMGLKRYYEQLLNVLDELQENENSFMQNSSLRYFKIFAGKIDRCYHSVLNLRDYVTQVREAYQAEEDLGLNYTMKIFTVVSTIFLPLTLIVGWYGMNLQMPEFKWAYSYPVVIALCLAVVGFCLYFFKKRKWF